MCYKWLNKYSCATKISEITVITVDGWQAFMLKMSDWYFDVKMGKSLLFLSWHLRNERLRKCQGTKTNNVAF
jgi:hypothetical protein